ncbi:DUF2269 family protein [Jeongeupia naejangsanensis]|uniref:DUF2269 domain-containing protein n=1 Tax=Jeongeupia naejangsanensis TaxID=613195 RepID=A0ABS2BID8_9NEIS|nr:DUF2269 domain-containing protein [Jeongeupia naejangsanensis]MBM3115380.1 DUF2269 domain-containing protein [Jeongeupia naejangsanensis]
MDYLIIKTLHILSATLMFGTGFGTAFYMFFCNRSRNVQAIAVVTRWVAKADWWFTTPAVIFQPLSGMWLLKQAGWSVGWNWVGLTLVLYAIAGLCWLPVVWLQLRMSDMARLAAANGDAALPSRYWRFERWWTVLGFPAFGGLLVVYWLMVAKPF